MPRDRAAFGSPQEWLSRSKSNLARAKLRKTDEIYWEDLCFDVQQAVEKALKALLLHRKIEFRLVHDIAELLTLLTSGENPVPDAVQEAAKLTDYAVQARYPGPSETVSEEEFREALAVGERVVAWVESEMLRAK